MFSHIHESTRKQHVKSCFTVSLRFLIGTEVVFWETTDLWRAIFGSFMSTRARTGNGCFRKNIWTWSKIWTIEQLSNYFIRWNKKYAKALSTPLWCHSNTWNTDLHTRRSPSWNEIRAQPPLVHGRVLYSSYPDIGNNGHCCIAFTVLRVASQSFGHWSRL